MAEKNLRDVNAKNKMGKRNRPAPEDSKWRLTCMNLGKGKELEGLDVGENTVDTNNTNFLEGKGAEKSANGELIIKTGNCRVERETRNGKKVVLRRVDESGKVLYENENLAKEEVR